MFSSSRRSFLTGLLAAAGAATLRLYSPMEARGVLEWTSGPNEGCRAVTITLSDVLPSSPADVERIFGNCFRLARDRAPS